MRNLHFSTLLLGLLLLPVNPISADDTKTEKKDSADFTVITECPITSIKNQNRSSTCWCFSGLGFLESELLRMNKGTYDFCEQFVIYHTMLDRARASVRLHGDISFSPGGSFYDDLYCLRNYGIVPQEAMPAAGSLYGDTLLNHNELDKMAGAYVNAIAKSDAKKLSPCWMSGLDGIYAAYLGKLPTTFTYKGKTYTPQSFYQSLGLNLDDYISLTSYTHHPYYTQFPIEVQDNWRGGLNYNLPLNELMEVMDYAVRHGYTFAWGADVSEEGFGHNGTITVPESKDDKDNSGSDQARWTGLAATNNKEQAAKDMKGERTITPELRQEGFDNWQTTDDHGMLIYGLAKDKNGKEFFMMKNSWGLYGKYKGIAYVSKAYMAYKTMNIMINKHALPKDIAKKLGL